MRNITHLCVYAEQNDAIILKDPKNWRTGTVIGSYEGRLLRHMVLEKFDSPALQTISEEVAPVGEEEGMEIRAS